MPALPFAQPIVTLLRWSVRLLGTALAAVLVSVYVGEGVLHGFYNPFAQAWPPLLQFLGMVLCLLGILAAWKEERLGGLMVMSGMAVFYTVEYLVNGNWPGGPVFPVFFVIGFVNLFCGWTNKGSFEHNSESTKPVHSTRIGQESTGTQEGG